MEPQRSMIRAEGLTLSDAISLLDAPHREEPRLEEMACPQFAFGLVWLVPVLLIVATAIAVWKAIAGFVVLPLR